MCVCVGGGRVVEEKGVPAYAFVCVTECATKCVLTRLCGCGRASVHMHMRA